MKWIIPITLFIILGSFAYADYGELGWGDCNEGYGLCNAASSSTTGGGGGGFTSGAEAGSLAFAAEASFFTEDSCEQSTQFSWYRGTCYKCSGRIVERDGGPQCLECNEGFILVGEQCRPRTLQKRAAPFIDNFLNRFFPDNEMLGLIIIVSAGFAGFAAYQNRVILERRIRRFFNREI